MKTALERSHDPDAATRYQAALDLAKEPGPPAAARLVALLDDPGEVCTDEGSSFHDVEPTYRSVSDAARDALWRMGGDVWPPIAAAWPTAAPAARRAMVGVLEVQLFDERARFPDDAHAILEASAREIGVKQKIAEAVWERAFAARVASGALADPEAFWRAAHDHPNPVERDRSLTRLAGVVTDPVALARELLELLTRQDVWPQYVVAALIRLPPVLPPSLVESIVASDVVRKYPETWAWLARHGDAARPLLAVCLEALKGAFTAGVAFSMPTMADDRRWRLASEAIAAFGPLSREARATLLDRLATTNEMMSLQGSLRRWLCELLGDAAAIEAELAPRLEEMERSADPVAVERARQLRHRFKVSRG